MPDNTPTLKDSDASCPNCGCLKPIQYDESDTRPVIFCQCTFCNAKFKWTKSKTEQIIDAEHQYHITIHLV